MEPSVESRVKILQNENNSLKEQLKLLKAQNKRKDRQLQAKSIIITNCNGQILRLKHDIHILQKKLVRAQSKKSSKARRKSMEKKHEIPYLVPERASPTPSVSNLSLEAAKLPFPDFPHKTPDHQPSSSKLPPIPENKDNSPEIILLESDNNHDIHIAEWGASIATISPSMPCEKSPKSTTARMATINLRVHAHSQRSSTSVVTYDIDSNMMLTPTKLDYLTITPETPDSVTEDAYVADICYRPSKCGYEYYTCDGDDYDHDLDTFNNSDTELVDKCSISYYKMNSNVTSDEETLSPMLTVVQHKSIMSQLTLNSVTSSKIKVDVLQMDTEEESMSDDPYDLELMFKGKSISDLSYVSDVETEQEQSGHSEFSQIHL